MNIFKNVLIYYRIILPLIIVLKYLLYKLLQNVHSYITDYVVYDNKSLLWVYCTSLENKIYYNKTIYYNKIYYNKTSQLTKIIIIKL